MTKVGVLFVCTGNICRSPTAEGALRKLLTDAGLGTRVEVDSAGLQGWHVGDPPDPRAVDCAGRRGYDLSSLRARQFGQADFNDFALIVGMDHGHVEQLRAARPKGATGDIRLFLEFLPPEDPHLGGDVPDPYYGDMNDYESSLDLIERGLPGLIESLTRDFP